MEEKHAAAVKLDCAARFPVIPVQQREEAEH